MFISSFQVINYKSFRSSEEMHFTPGFNIVVGQNSAGKTALIEALGLTFPDKPHRSLTTVPTPFSIVDEHSSARITFGVEPVEALEVFSHLKVLSIPVPREMTPEQVTNRFIAFIGDTFKVSGTLQRGRFTEFKIVDYTMTGTPGATELEYSPGTGKIASSKGRYPAQSLGQFAITILETLKSHIYLFRAERFNVTESHAGTDSVLTADARNLPGVLHLLQSSNPYRFNRFIKDVRTVFPDIWDVSVVPIGIQSVRINVWFIDPASERKDLVVPLADCGTGVGQVLAILYVVLNSERSRTILIDEPQSFLHPGAIRKLFDILKRYPQHQYVVTTHSPTVVTAANPRTLLLLRRQDNETKVETINVKEADELRSFLSDVGARLSDVFGADSILWVEGRTEEICFRIIVEKLLKTELLGTDIIGVKQVGDLEGRHAKTVLEIYQRLCAGRGLLPPAVGFCFDQEGRSETERAGLSADSNGMIQFIPRRMYENYLLNPKAVAAVLIEADKANSPSVSEQDVEAWIVKKGKTKPYMNFGSPDHWLETVNAAKLLNDLFNDLSATRVCFDKINHGVKLTEWLIKNQPADLEELANFLKTILAKNSAKT